MRDLPWLGEEPQEHVAPDPWGLEEPGVPASVAAALSAATVAVLTLIAVLVA